MRGFVFYFIGAFLATLPAAVQSEERELTVYHSFNGGKDFVPRGTLRLVVNPDATDEDRLKLTLEDANISKQDVETMVQTGFYQIQLEEAIATVPACQVRRAQFHDEIVVTFGTHANVLSLSLTPLVSPLAPGCDELSEPGEASLVSRLEWEAAIPQMVLRKFIPPTKPSPGLVFLKNPSKKIDPESMGEEQQPPQGFFRRYWYIIVPVMLMNLLGGAEDPRSQEGGEQQQGAPSQQGSAPAAAPSTAGGGGATRRRGKRG